MSSPSGIFAPSFYSNVGLSEFGSKYVPVLKGETIDIVELSLIERIIRAFKVALFGDTETEQVVAQLVKISGDDELKAKLVKEILPSSTTQAEAKGKAERRSTERGSLAAEDDLRGAKLDALTRRIQDIADSNASPSRVRKIIVTVQNWFRSLLKFNEVQVVRIPFDPQSLLSFAEESVYGKLDYKIVFYNPLKRNTELTSKEKNAVLAKMNLVALTSRNIQKMMTGGSLSSVDLNTQLQFVRQGGKLAVKNNGTEPYKYIEVPERRMSLHNYNKLDGVGGKALASGVTGELEFDRIYKLPLQSATANVRETEGNTLALKFVKV